MKLEQIISENEKRKKRVLELQNIMSTSQEEISKLIPEINFASGQVNILESLEKEEKD